VSTLAEKLDKQFAYQRTLHATSGDPMDLFLSGRLPRRLPGPADAR